MPGPPHPGLDLVEHERRADAVAGGARGGEQLAVEHVDAGLALDRLEQHGGRAARGRRRRAPRDRGATATKPGTSGANGACLDSCGVAESAPYVRPWKPPCSTTISPRGRALRTSLSAASLASAPELAKYTRPPSERAHSRSASSTIGAVEEQVADVHQPRGLLLHRGDDPRVAVAGVVDRDAGEEVEVLVAVGVPERGRPPPGRTRPGSGRRCASARRSQRGPDLRADAGVREQLEQQRVRQRARRRCGRSRRRRGSRRGRPGAWGACRRAIAGSAASTSAAVVSEITESGSAGSASQPATSVRKIDLVGAERAGDGAGGLVGVDVVRAAVRGRRRPTR